MLALHVQVYFGPVGHYPFYEAYLAVDFFFVLSGFVLAHAYSHRFGHGLTAWGFMKIRLIRLYPLYLLGLLLAAAAWLPYPVWLARNLPSALLFLPSPPGTGTGKLFPLNGPAWSLFFELLANAAFGLMGRRLTTSRLVAIVAVAGCALALAVQFKLLGFGSTGAAMADGFQWGSIGAGLLRVSYSFFSGVLVYRIWEDGQPKGTVSPLIVAAALIAVLAANPGPEYAVLFDLAATLLVFPMLVGVASRATISPIIARPTAILGTASYAVYVLQEPIYTIVSGFWPDGLAGIAGFMALAFATALAADRWLDQPARRWLTENVKRIGPLAGRLGALPKHR